MATASVPEAVRAELQRIDAVSWRQEVDADVAAWHRHDDERVAVAAVRRFRSPLAGSLAAQAIAERLAREPAVWTPYAAMLWSYDAPRAQAGAHRDAFQRWLRHETDPVELVAAAQVRCRYVQRAIAVGARAWSPALVDALHADDGEAPWSLLLKNPALTGVSLTHLIAVLWARVRDAVPSNAYSANEAAQVLVALADRGHPLPGSVPVLVDALYGVPGPTRADPVGALAGTMVRAARGLSSAILDRVYASAKRSGPGLVALLGHPELSSAYARQALEDHPTTDVRHAIANTPRFLADPAVRALLLGQGMDSYVLKRVHPHAAPGEVDARYVAFLTHRPALGLTVLAGMDAAAPVIGVPEAIVTRLLGGDETMRMEALRSLSKMDVVPATPRVTRAARSRRSRGR
jgi:hypothetical protein